MLRFIYDNTLYCKEIEYVIKLISDRLGVEILVNEKIQNENDIVLYYGVKDLDKKNIVKIIPGSLFSDTYLAKDSIPDKVKYYAQVPVIFYNNEKENLYININDNRVITNIDIIQSIFFMITRYEEVVLWDTVDRDLYDRFPATESVAYKNNFLNIPVVDEYINLFWKWLKQAGYKGERKEYFGEYDFAACLTHDVDIPFKYTENLKKYIKPFKEKGHTINKFRDIIKYTISRIDYRKDPCYTFEYIRECEKKYNFTSSFYFMNGGESKKIENFYSFYDYRIQSLIKYLENDDCEVGYHYSYYASNNLDMRKKKKDLDKVFKSRIYGGRNHFLRFDPKWSWKVCEDSNMLYDATLCFADYDGFRCGTCFPFKPYDIINRRQMNFYEIPLIVMEGTLKEKKYRNLDCDKAFNEIKHKIDIVRKYNGVFTLLWHNSSFNDQKWKGWNVVFEKTMKYLYDNKCKGMSGKQLIYDIDEGIK